MKNTIASINGTNLVLPGGFMKLESAPEDPENSRVFGRQAELCSCFMQVYPLAKEDAMPYGLPRLVIDSIHSYLGDSQGLVAVKNGSTAQGRPYLYSIVKSRNDPEGMQYILSLEVNYKAMVLHIQAYFSETGRIGDRDTIGYELAVRDKKVKNGSLEGWMKDPYDAEFTRGILANLAEGEDYDRFFPGHALTELRAFAASVIALN